MCPMSNQATALLRVLSLVDDLNAERLRADNAEHQSRVERGAREDLSRELDALRRDGKAENARLLEELKAARAAAAKVPALEARVASLVEASEAFLEQADRKVRDATVVQHHVERLEHLGITLPVVEAPPDSGA